MRKNVTEKALLAKAAKLMAERIIIPEDRSGDVRIEHRRTDPGGSIPVVGLRESFYTGLPQCSLTFKDGVETTWLLSEEHGTWMSDMPCEIVQMERELVQRVSGNVLIGGLGLGILANMVSKRSKVRKIVVVENSPHVIKLVGPHMPRNVEIVEADVHDFVKVLKKGEFGTALLDTWQSTGEWTWQTEVVPLRRVISNKIRATRCWQESVMRGQVIGMLGRVADLDEGILRRAATNHYYAFRCGVRDLGIRKKPRIDVGDGDFASMMEIAQDNERDLNVQWLMRRFLVDVGTVWWERIFGRYWDEASGEEAD